MQTLTIAWRNIWRNRRRTAITVAAVGLNTAILIATFALIEGSYTQIIANITELAVGDAQVHAEGYLDDRSLYKAVKQPEAILAKARAANIKAVARAYGYGLVAVGSKSAGAMFWGVDPSAEREGFGLAERVADGRYVAPQAKGGVVIGRRLAKSLHAEVGAEFIALVQSADGSLGNELFTIVGILRSSTEDVDRSGAILHRDDFDRLFLAGGRVHEIAFNTQGKTPLDKIEAAIGPVGEGNEYKTWKELMPMLADMMQTSQGMTFIFAFIFFLAAGFGVLNTMLMATHDRVNEYGVLKALGASPGRIIREVATEGLMLALVSTVFGVVIGVAGAIYLEQVGIDLSGENSDISMMGVVFDPIYKGVLRLSDVIVTVVAMCFFSVLASLYPAVKAARLDPVEAMNHV